MVSTPMTKSPRAYILAASSILVLSALATGPISPVLAQQPAAQQPVLTVKAQSNEVILPVTVRDKKGQIVSNLKQDDFTLTEDGKPQAIKSFTSPINQPLRLGLLIDTSRSQSNALEGERSASGKFVDQMIAQPADKAFLLHFDHEVELLQDFTASKDKLHHELDGMSSAKGGNGSDQEPEVRGGSGDDDDSQSRRGHRGGTQMYDAIYLAANELMSSQPGRKAVVLFSDGVDRGSKESLSDAVDAAEKANVSVYTVYFKGEEEHRPMEQGMGRRGGMGGGGYPGGGGGYPGGGRRGGQSPSSEAHVDGKKILEQIATRTGGRFFEAKKKDSFEEACNQITEELKGQYLLTYSPAGGSSGDPGDFHKIALKAKNDQLTVFTREGYFTPAK